MTSNARALAVLGALAAIGFGLVTGIVALVMWGQADSVLGTAKSIGLQSSRTRLNEYHVLAFGFAATAGGLLSVGVAILAMAVAGKDRAKPPLPADPHPADEALSLPAPPGPQAPSSRPTDSSVTPPSGPLYQ